MSYKKVLAFIACITISFIAFSSKTYAVGGATGGGESGGINSSGVGTNFDCYTQQHCPRWVLVNKATYAALQNRIWLGNYSGLDTCGNDDWVVVAANIPPSGDGGLYILNYTEGTRPNPHKEDWRSVLSWQLHLSKATAINNVWAYNFMNDIAGKYNGQNITYEKLLELAVKELNTTEKDLAAFCMSTIVEQTYTRRLTLLGSSDPATDFPSGKTWTKDSSIIKNNIIDYDDGGFSNGINKQTVTAGNSYNSATAPKTITVNGIKYTINRIIATDYVGGKADCYGDNISFKHSQSEAFTNSGVVNGCQDIYAVYEKPKVTLNAYAISTDKQTFLNNGNKLATNPSSMPVLNGTSVSATEPGFTGYTFKGWYAAGSNSKAGCKTYATKITTSRTYSTTLTASGTICAVYELQKRTLTARAKPDNDHFFKPDGTIVPTSDSSGIWTNSHTVDYNNTASVSSSGFNPEGYTWNKWGSQGACSSAGTDRNCSVSNLTSNTTVNAFYTRNSFRARARVSEGASWPGTNSVNSGFVKATDEASSINVQCTDNSGCMATFWFDLKTETGTGSTVYSIQRRSDSKNSSGGWDWSDVSGYSNNSVKPDSGNDGSLVFTVGEKRPIGSRTCYRIRYKPYGDEANTAFKAVTACATIEASTFIGKTELSGATTAVAGYTSKSDPKSINEVAKIENCSPTSGCAISFKHYLKRTSGIASTTYNVSRKSNLITSTKAISAGSIKGDTAFGSNNETVVSESANLILYPGMVVCERLTFKPNNLSGTTGNIYTQVCAHAHGDAQPPDDPSPDNPEDPNKDSGDTSFINIKVRNPDAADKYSNYQREVYAKPGDEVVYRATYNPVLQYTYYLVPQKFQINGGTIYPASGINTESQTWTLFNTYKGGALKNWNNAFSVQKGINNASYGLVANYAEYSNGDWSKHQETNNYTVDTSDVGKSIDEKAATNLNDDTKTTPSQVSFRDDGSGNNLANVITDRKESKIASAKVPYNFINDTELISPENLKAYAGEPLTVNYKYIINPKTNSETSPNEPYATKVVNPQWRLAVKIGDGEWQSTTAQTQSSFSVSTSEMGAGKSYNRSTAINIPDVAAGTVVCVAPQVYPTNSGADTNYTNTKGSDAWTPIDSSKQSCFKVAKKPSIEIWGGNTYSRGAIETSVAAKNNLEGYTTYNLNNSDGNGKNRYIFGSWTESGLISNGRVKGLASGASTGFAINDNGTLWPAYHPEDGAGNNALVSGGNPAPGGSFEVNQNFCIRSVLTFANEGCNGVNGMAGGLSSANVISSTENDKTTILRKFIPASFDANTSGDVALNDDAKIIDNGNYYYYGKDSLNVVGSNIRKDTTQVVHSDQNITISGNLVYDSAGGYATLEEIPKLVIYAQNVTIACSVSRIDALIVAEEQVKTCDSDDVNSSVNSNQLKINGAIIANSLVANRTYGAATGANSIIPAEIINYDPSLYLLGNDSAKGGSSANEMDTTYIHEVAPRY